jgi:hypothetical protein
MGGRASAFRAPAAVAAQRSLDALPFPGDAAIIDETTFIAGLDRHTPES